jgi:hypothetical protein
MTKVADEIERALGRQPGMEAIEGLGHGSGPDSNTAHDAKSSDLMRVSIRSSL